MATLHEYYLTAFPRLMSVHAQHQAQVQPGKQIPITVRVHLDFDASVKFLSIYVPSGVSATEVARHYISTPQDALNVGAGLQVGTSFGGLPQETHSSELTFSGRLFVYCEDQPSPAAMAETIEFARSKGIKVVFRSADYRNERNRYERPAAFISHDSRDKKTVAAPIAVGLANLLCPVWYDEFALKVGDPLRQSIEKGIKECRTCVLIISPDFLANEGWTKAEFDSIYTREVIERKNVILPVWHNVSAKEVYEYSPRLADKKAVQTAVGIEEVCRQLKVAIDHRPD